MSAWSLAQGLAGCAGFLRKQAGEELQHMSKLFDYISPALVQAIDAPPQTFDSVEHAFKQAFAHEQREEEHVFRTILEKLEMIGPDTRGLFFFDREIGALASK